MSAYTRMSIRRLRTAALMVFAGALLWAPVADAAIPRTSRIAKIIAPTVATAKPTGGATVMKLPTTLHWGGPTQLRVLGSQKLADGSLSYRVLLPKRPNGSTGWVHSDRVNLLTTRYFIVIDLSQRLVVTYQSGRVAQRDRVVVGAPSTPTPRGEFFVTEKLKTNNPNAFTGSWILSFGFSNVLKQFAGGPGIAAMHGRGGQSLATPLGTAASHGCVRMNNSDIAWIARRAPEGTPVRIRA